MKILFVDTWIRGLSFINPVAKYFNDKDELFFIHSSSLYGDGDSRKLIADFPGISADSSSFGHRYSDFLDELKPDVVIFITAHGLVQRYFNHLCSSRGVPCFYYMHGARFSERMPPRLKFGVAHLIRRMVLYGMQSFYFLRDSFFRNRQIFFKCSYFLYEFFFFKDRFNLNPSSNFGLSYDKVLINHSADIAYFDNFFGRKQCYEIVGNVSVHEHSLTGKTGDKRRDSVVFLTQPDCIDDVKELGIAMDLHKICVNTNLRLIIRLHPGEKDNGEVYSTVFGDCVIDNDSNMTSALSVAKLLVGFNSAALLAGQVIGIPTLSYNTKNFVALPYLDRNIDFFDPTLVSDLLIEAGEIEPIIAEHPAKLIVKHIYASV